MKLILVALVLVLSVAGCASNQQHGAKEGADNGVKSGLAAARIK